MQVNLCASSIVTILMIIRMMLMRTVITMTLVMDGDDGLLNELGSKDPFQGQNCCKDPC